MNWLRQNWKVFVIVLVMAAIAYALVVFTDMPPRQPNNPMQPVLDSIYRDAQIKIEEKEKEIEQLSQKLQVQTILSARLEQTINKNKQIYAEKIRSISSLNYHDRDSIWSARMAEYGQRYN